MLTALVELAESEGLLAELDYEPKNVTHVIELDMDGRLLSRPTDIRETTARGKPKGKSEQVPKEPPGRTSGIKPRLLCDNSQYVLGFKLEKNGIRSTDKHLEAAISLMQWVATESSDAGAQSVLKFLQHQGNNPRRTEVVKELDLSNVDPWFLFRVHDQPDRYVHERDKIRAWWHDRRRSYLDWLDAKMPPIDEWLKKTVLDSDGIRICLVTGEESVPARLHGTIKSPGPNQKGVPIVSFNKRAFLSYGFDGSENAPVSQKMVDAYVTALNRLLDPAWAKPGVVGETLPNRRIILNDNTAAVFWAAEAANEFANMFSVLLDSANEDSVRRLFESPRSGALPYLDDKTPFYVLTISGGQGRATVRGWLTDTVSGMAARMRRWFEDLELEFGPGQPPRPFIRALLRASATLGKDENIPPNLAAEVFDSILRDRPLPMTLLGAAVRRNKAEGPECQRYNKKNDPLGRAHLRMQLLKATLLRLKRAYPDSYPNLPEVLPMLDESNTSPAYLLGRLFSTLERLQESALGKTNATVGDRFYGAASTAPASAFPRLLNLSRHHLAKLRKEKPAWAVSVDRTLGQILDNFPAHSFPSVLPMEEQGLFALGYYHQRQASFRKKSGDTEVEESTSSASEEN